jgi:hypothetical protein
VIWFAPFQGVGDDDGLIVRYARPTNPLPPPAEGPSDEELHVKAL